MNPTIVIRPAAQADLDDNAEYIARKSPSAARRFLAAAKDAFDKLAKMPGLGSQWPTSNPRLQGIRLWPIRKFPNHLVFYRVTKSGIEVLHVFHGARNIDAILEAEQH